MKLSRSGAADPLLLLEAVLALALFGLAIAFFIIPAARATLLPSWWAGIILAILFFAVVFLETIRRRRRGREELHRALGDAPPAAREPEDRAS